MKGCSAHNAHKLALSCMRPKLHLPVRGHTFRVTGVMACFVIWKAALCHIDLFESS